MDILTIQITNNKAYKLLKDLEELKIIKVLKSNVSSKQKLSEKYAGKMSSDVADNLQKHVKEIRKEWQR
jgi:hypothetical protein